MEGALQRLAEAARQVNIRRVYHQPLCRLLDADDAVERVLALLRCLLVARQADHLVLALGRDCAVQGHDAGGKPVVDAMARRAKTLVRVSWSRPPLPPSVMVDRAALPAGRRLRQLLPRLIGVENVIALGAAGDAPPGPPPVMMAVPTSCWLLIPQRPGAGETDPPVLRRAMI